MPKSENVRQLASKALLQLLEPILAFAIDAGLSAGDVCWLARCAAVNSVARQQSADNKKINISGIAAITGIPRAEVSKVLKSVSRAKVLWEGKQNSVSHILAAWHREPRFVSKYGGPAELPIYGRGATFEKLVKEYGRGIPTRAVLDELIRTKTVEVIDARKVRARASVAIERGISPAAIRSFGARATELIETMLANMKYPELPRFIATVSVQGVPVDSLPVVKREVATKSTNFLEDIQEILSQELPSKRKRDSESFKVTVFCHENRQSSRRPMSQRRTNLRRVHRSNS
jgi:hypothetical protein